MPRPGLPLVHFDDTRCDSAAELRSVILKARRLAHDHAEQERAATAVKAWLLAQIEKKRAATADSVKTAPHEPFAPERLCDPAIAVKLRIKNLDLPVAMDCSTERRRRAVGRVHTDGPTLHRPEWRTAIPIQ
jgi:hypothetical protein